MAMLPPCIHHYTWSIQHSARHPKASHPSALLASGENCNHDKLSLQTPHGEGGSMTWYGHSTVATPAALSPSAHLSFT